MDNIKDITRELTEKLIGWWDSAILMLPNFCMALAVVVLFALLAKLVRKGVAKLMSKASDNQAIGNLISTMAYGAVLIVGLFFALGILDLDKTVTSLLAGVGVIGLALGFAFQNTASNFISGVLMASDFPLKVGHIIESNDHFGIVEAINIRYTTMKNFKGQLIVIPNREILEDSLVNYSITGERRVDVECGVGYGMDLEKSEQIAIKAVEEMSVSIKPVEVMYGEFGDSSINFTLRFWITDASHKDYLSAKSKAVKAIKKAYDAEGINIPFPIRTLEFRPSQLESMIKGVSARGGES